MENRINIHGEGQTALRSLYSLGSYLAKSPVEEALLNLVYYRVSQINGCAYCLDMHSKDLLAKGENLQRLLVLDAWREAPFYTERERVALSWAESLTKLNGSKVADEVYREAIQQFNNQELIDLTMAVIAINSYNRINLAFSAPVGDYQPGQYSVAK